MDIEQVKSKLFKLAAQLQKLNARQDLLQGLDRHLTPLLPPQAQGQVPPVSPLHCGRD